MKIIFKNNLTIENNFKNININISSVDYKPRVYKFGGMDIRMHIQKLPKKLKQTSFEKEFNINLNKSNYQNCIKQIKYFKKRYKKNKLFKT